MDQSPRHVVCPSCGTVNRIPPARPASEAKCGRCHERLFAGAPVPATAEAFERHRTRNDIPVVVDFWAPWCGPCRAMTPAYERAAAELEPEHRLLKVNTVDVPALAARYGIQSIPTLMLFRRGKEVARQSGAMTNAQQISRWAGDHLAPG